MKWPLSVQVCRSIHENGAGDVEDLFHINENLSESDRQAIIGRFKSAHNASDAVAERQAMTFLSLLKLADISTSPSPKKQKQEQDEVEGEQHTQAEKNKTSNYPLGFSGLRYNVEIHLPATKDVEVYNSIFKSLKAHLLDD